MIFWAPISYVPDPPVSVEPCPLASYYSSFLPSQWYWLCPRLDTNGNPPVYKKKLLFEPPLLLLLFWCPRFFFSFYVGINVSCLNGRSAYLPDRSVTWTKVSLNEAKMWATPKTFSPSGTWGPRLTCTSGFCTFPLRGAIFCNRGNVQGIEGKTES